MLTVTLFIDGGDQCVPLPEGFTFDGDEVLIRKEGDQLILESVKIESAPQGD